MAFSLFMANEGYLDDVAINKVVDFETAMLAHVKSNNADLVASINDTGDYNDEIEASMRAALDDFKAKGVF